MITTAFLVGSADESERDQFHAAAENYKSLFTSMTKNLKEAKYEYYVMGREREYNIEARLVRCMEKLGQDIGGLRSAASTQFLLLAQGPSAGNATPVDGGSASFQRRPSFSVFSDGEASDLGNQGILTAIDEVPEDERHAASGTTSPSALRSSAEDINYLPTAKAPGDIFSSFITHLGPSMVSSVTVKAFSSSRLRFSRNPSL